MSYSKKSKIGTIHYSQPKLDKRNPIIFATKGLWTPVVNVDNIAYQSLFRPFNLNQYLYPRPPIDMGLMEVPRPHLIVNVLRMPLKFPKTEYRIPGRFAFLEKLIRRVAEYEAFINQQHDNIFCHLTYDRADVEVGTYHRFPGFHGDGIQGSKLTPNKAIIEHSYIMGNTQPAEFCLQPFFLKHLDEAKHNFFLEFDRQAKETNVYGTIPNHLYLIDPYMVHRTPQIKKKASRAFIRITYAFTELRHPKNTVNPLFDGQEYEDRIDIRENLMANEFDVPYHLYGLTKVD